MFECSVLFLEFGFFCFVFGDCGFYVLLGMLSVCNLFSFLVFI